MYAPFHYSCNVMLLYKFTSITYFRYTLSLFVMRTGNDEIVSKTRKMNKKYYRNRIADGAHIAELQNCRARSLFFSCLSVLFTYMTFKVQSVKKGTEVELHCTENNIFVNTFCSIFDIKLLNNSIRNIINLY